MYPTAHEKVHREHRERKAYLYVRQSTPRQVSENTESIQTAGKSGRRAETESYGETLPGVVTDEVSPISSQARRYDVKPYSGCIIARRRYTIS